MPMVASRVQRIIERQRGVAAEAEHMPYAVQLQEPHQRLGAGRLVRAVVHARHSGEIGLPPCSALFSGGSSGASSPRRRRAGSLPMVVAASRSLRAAASPCNREDAMRKLLASAAVLAAMTTGGAAMAQTASPEGAEVYIVSPADGATVSSPVTVVFGLRGMGVAPAGDHRERECGPPPPADRPPAASAKAKTAPRSWDLRHHRATTTTGTSAAARPRSRWSWRRARTRCSSRSATRTIFRTIRR